MQNVKFWPPEVTRLTAATATTYFKCSIYCYLVLEIGLILSWCCFLVTFVNQMNRVDLRLVPSNRVVFRSYGEYVYVLLFPYSYLVRFLDLLFWVTHVFCCFSLYFKFIGGTTYLFGTSSFRTLRACYPTHLDQYQWYDSLEFSSCFAAQLFGYPLLLTIALGETHSQE